jgi:hypothetical protein
VADHSRRAPRFMAISFTRASVIRSEAWVPPSVGLDGEYWGGWEPDAAALGGGTSTSISSSLMGSPDTSAVIQLWALPMPCANHTAPTYVSKYFRSSWTRRDMSPYVRPSNKCGTHRMVIKQVSRCIAISQLGLGNPFPD